MEDNSSINRSAPHVRYGFLYRKCSCGRLPLTKWLYVPEFVAELDAMTEQGVSITDETLLPVMKKIYDQKLEERRALRKVGIRSDFEFGHAKSGIKDIRQAIERKLNEGSHV